MATATPQRAGVSPSSSPRLPSPPPFTEVQFGPKSPGIGASVSELQLDTSEQDDGAARRIRPGTKASEMARGPPFVQLHQLESPFQLQEYLKALYHKLTRDEENSNSIPINKDTATQLATPPTTAETGETVDRNLWLYELCRLLCSKTTRMIVAFFSDNPPCSSQTCPEMRASEWQYLCAVHEPPKSCCAIDYCNHTLDWASNVLTSSKHFPSRLSLAGDGGNAFQSMRQLTNIFRRVYRIYAHAWFQHREVFWQIETELGLYMLFKTVCDVYQLIPEDNYTIPPEAEGPPEKVTDSVLASSSPQQKQILQKDPSKSSAELSEASANTTVSTGATTRRHKHTPSTGVPVAIITEGAEDDEDEEDLDTSQLSGPGPAEETTKLSPPILSPRPKSPGQIQLPVNDEPERAPEDPTPIAQHETNPLADHGAASLLSSTPSHPTLSTNIISKPSGSSPQTAVSSAQDHNLNTLGSTTTDSTDGVNAETSHTGAASIEAPQDKKADTMEKIEPLSVSPTHSDARPSQTAASEHEPTGISIKSSPTSVSQSEVPDTTPSNPQATESQASEDVSEDRLVHEENVESS